MWSMILLMSRPNSVIPCLRTGDQKSSVTNSQQSAGRHYQAIGVDWVGRRHVCKGPQIFSNFYTHISIVLLRCFLSFLGEAGRIEAYGIAAEKSDVSEDCIPG